MSQEEKQTPVCSSSDESIDYDDSTDSSEREFIEQQEKARKEKEKVHLPRKSSTILMKKEEKEVRIVEDDNIDHDEFDSDDEDMNCSNLNVYEHLDRVDFCVTHTAGRRNYNEDRACVYHDEEYDLFAVFDGHNGHEGATLCRNVLKETYLRCGKQLVETFASLHQQVIEKTGSGCTVTVVVIKKDEIEFANCGDSCAYIIKKDKSIKKMTYDHKASDPKEEEMIQKNGGCVMNIFGAKRVNGQIMVTRSLGDRSLHPPMSCEPFINSCKFDEIESICLMSDGVTDVLTEDEIRQIMLNYETVQEKSQQLRNQAYKGGSKDNICAIVIDL